MKTDASSVEHATPDAPASETRPATNAPAAPQAGGDASCAQAEDFRTVATENAASGSDEADKNAESATPAEAADARAKAPSSDAASSFSAAPAAPAPDVSPTAAPAPHASPLQSDAKPAESADISAAEAQSATPAASAPAGDAEKLRMLPSFDPDTAAGVMNTDIIMVSSSSTVDEAIMLIRSELEEKEMPYYVYVVDSQETLEGVISLRDLMLARPGTLLTNMVNKQDVISVQYDTDKAEVARLLGHYNFLCLPVVDREEHLMGVVTHDDVLDIIQDEASSDMLGMVGAGQDENVDTPWTRSVRIRLPWLVINMCTSSLSAFIVSLFEGSIAQMALLAVLMPMVANQAGNTGQQALAVMIRQLATESFDARRSWGAVFRESKIGLGTGIFMALLAYVGVMFLSHNSMLATVMGIALLLDMLLGAIAGGAIPLILRALGRDPAQASSIFLTALTDSGGFFIFLGLATTFLL